MSNETFFSTIRSDTKKRLFFRALLLSIPGVFLLLGMGTFASIAAIQSWGTLTFFVGMGLIAWGMIPYRKITQLETKPYKIIVSEEAILFILHQGKQLHFTHGGIQEVEYIEKKCRYGINLKTKEGKAFFLPYFSTSTYRELHHYLKLARTVSP